MGNAVRIGLMVGPERGRYATKVERMRADAAWAEEAGLSTVWVPQIPDEFDALDGRRAGRRHDLPHRDRHGRGARAAPSPDRARAAGPVDAGGLRRPAPPRPRRLAPLDHRRDARPPLRAAAGHHALVPRRARAGTGRPGTHRRRERALPGAPAPRRHRHRLHPGPARRARPPDAPAGRRAHRRDDPVAGRRAGHRRPRRPPHHRAPRRRPAVPPRASWPASPCASAATTRSRWP